MGVTFSEGRRDKSCLEEARKQVQGRVREDDDAMSVAASAVSQPTSQLATKASARAVSCEHSLLAEPAPGALPGWVCSFCKRKDSHPNPCPKRYAQSTLKFATSSECICCRNYWNSTMKGKQTMTREKFGKILKAESKFNDYLKSIGEFEAFFNDTDPNKQLRNSGDQISLPSWVYAEETEGTVGHTNLGTFWPYWALDHYNDHSMKDSGVDLLALKSKLTKDLILIDQHNMLDSIGKNLEIMWEMIVENLYLIMS